MHGPDTRRAGLVAVLAGRTRTRRPTRLSGDLALRAVARFAVLIPAAGTFRAARL